MSSNDVTSQPDGLDPQGQHDLCAQDAAALDALCASGYDATTTPAELRERADRLMRLMSALGTPLPLDTVSNVDSSLLIDATCAMVARARRDVDAELSPRDQDALDALVSAGMDPRRCPSALRDRARAHADVLASLDVPVDAAARESLIARTLALAGKAESDRQDRMSIGPTRRAGFKPRWADLISVAALVMLSAAVLTPMLGAVRGYQQRSGCEANMVAAGVGFGSYAGDFRDLLPLASSSPAGSKWWNVGRPEESNSANLYTLIRTGHVNTEALACPGNKGACREVRPGGERDWHSLDEVSYSYQNMFARERPKWTQPITAVVIADRSPVIPLAQMGRRINPMANSLNHQGKGQIVLRNDGSAAWLRTPVLEDGDNLWLPREVEQLIERLKRPTEAQPLDGKEAPADAEDAFVGP